MDGPGETEPVAEISAVSGHAGWDGESGSLLMENEGEREGRIGRISMLHHNKEEFV
jgi:hypothetical protein